MAEMRGGISLFVHKRTISGKWVVMPTSFFRCFDFWKVVSVVETYFVFQYFFICHLCAEYAPSGILMARFFESFSEKLEVYLQRRRANSHFRLFFTCISDATKSFA